MMVKLSYRPLRLLLLSLVLMLAAGAGATGLTHPHSLFTDNIAAAGPSLAITPMEQTLLDYINGAAVSIDAAIYDFKRASVRDALIAAHDRGVRVRLVADDEARANPGYSPYFTALENAGIPVVDDGRSSIMHNKFLVIDGQIVWSGSTNLSDNGFSYNHNNSLVFASTELAGIYSREFEEMFVDGLFGSAKSDNSGHTLDYNGIPLELYFSPSGGAMARMQSGVVVSGVWDSLGAANAYSEDERLCAAGAAIKREDFGGKLHHKFMVIDANGSDPTVITGSMNWTGAGDEAGTLFTFPSFSLPAAAALRVWTRAGSDSSSELYWGRGTAVWNNSGDTATLRDAAGRLIDSCRYSGGGMLASCRP